jgi:rhodanese-related sulfurtransferase
VTGDEDQGVSLDPKRVAEMVQAGEAQLVDVREPDEREKGRIGAARHIPLDQLPARAEEIDPDRPVVFHCQGGNRSAMAAEAFRQSGYDAYNLAGGLTAWEEQGLPVDRDSSPGEGGAAGDGGAGES